MSQRAIFEGYTADAGELVPRFEGLRSEIVLAPVLDLVPPGPGKALDVGAGTGRDAAWLETRGHYVLAVEPVEELRRAGQALHKGRKLEWLDDCLPLLRRTRSRGESFDVILCIAVWQHLPSAQHSLALSPISSLLATGGRAIISVRHGPGAANRPCFPANTERLIADGGDAGLNLMARRRAGSVQPRNRAAGVRWDWLCFAAERSG